MQQDRDESNRMTIVHTLDEIPRFASETEEAAYWGTHALSEDLWDRLPLVADDDLPTPHPRTRSIAIRFDDVTLRRVKALAKKQHTGYQTLIKRFVAERLYEEEKREGLV
jgi:hypothetical protein